jgi:hypothetical protein
LEDVPENIESKTIQPIKNHPLELRRIKTELKTSSEPIWDPAKNKAFWYHETIVTSPHVKESEIYPL